jgi:hypothetical protein
VYTTAAGSGNIPGVSGGPTQLGYTNFSLSTDGSHGHNVGVGSAGGDWGHIHGLTMNNMDFTVAYTDVILCQKA